MATIQVDLPPELTAGLDDIAERLGIPVAAVIQLSIETMLQRTEDAFQQAMEDVLSKNLELYRRLL